MRNLSINLNSYLCGHPRKRYVPYGIKLVPLATEPPMEPVVNLLKAFFVLSLFLTLGGLCTPALADIKVVGYQSWKARRILEAQSLYQQVRTEVRVALSSARNRRPENSRRLQERLEQARLNVQIARELSPNDYFVLYVRERRHTNPAAFIQAVERMSNPEVAEILNAYHNQLLKRDLPSETSIRIYQNSETARRMAPITPSGRIRR